ncbi:MAG TPA: prepilin peptidase [Myxococcales bacterium]|jgi:leader peptidase (prepilin peptidase)/N-methyltransferase
MELLEQAMPVTFALFVFALGAVVGSFLNVVIARVPRGESVVSPASRCPRCKSAIRWYDNVPVLSWMVLRGKCRDCGLPISPRYPLVELLVGLLAVGIVRELGPTWVALGYFAFAAALVALAYIDLDTWLLPAQITWPLLALGLVSPLWNRELGFRDAIIGGVVGYALFAGIALFGEKVLKREVMGWGDVWLLGGIGAWLGWGALLPVVLMSALQGALVGSLLLWLGKGETGEPRKDAADAPITDVAVGADVPVVSTEAAEEDWVPPKNAVPYGPFLALAALEYLLAGARIVSAWDSAMQRLLG